MLCIAEEKDTDTISYLESSSYDFWEWSSREAEELFNIEEPNTPSVHPFWRNDCSLIRSLVLKPDVRVLNSTDAQKAKNDLDHLDAKVRRAGEDAPEELQEIREELFGITLDLTRLQVPLKSLVGGSSKIINSLSLLTEKAQRSLYLDEDEKKLTFNVIESLQCFAVHLEESNLKEDAIIQASRSNEDVRVLMPPRFPEGISSLQNESKNNELFLPLQRIREVEYGTLIIPYWPGHRKAWDILSNPPSREICFILYSFEDKWRSAFFRKRDRSRTQRAESNHRAAIFNYNYKWSRPPVPAGPSIKPEEMDDDSLIEEQDFQNPANRLFTLHEEKVGWQILKHK